MIPRTMFTVTVNIDFPISASKMMLPNLRTCYTILTPTRYVLPCQSDLGISPRFLLT